MQNAAKVFEVTETWQEMNICDENGPGLPAQKVFDITSYCSKVKERNGRLLMRFALSKACGQLVQLLHLNARGEPSGWTFYIVEDILYTVKRPEIRDEKFVLHNLRGHAGFLGIALDALVKLIAEHRP